MEKKYSTLKEFYPFYLEEHQNHTCRILHFVGTGLVLLILVGGIVSGKYGWLFTIR